jgi:transposase
MGAPHSGDLRERVVAAVAGGSSRRAAAARFQVSAASAVRWAALEKQTGSVRPRPRRALNRSPLEAHGAWLLELVAKEPGLTLAQTEQRLIDELGVKTTERSIRRFYKRHKITFKKNSARGRAGPARRGRRPGALESRPAGA